MIIITVFCIEIQTSHSSIVYVGANIVGTARVLTHVYSILSQLHLKTSYFLEGETWLCLCSLWRNQSMPTGALPGVTCSCILQG